jgi:hypothetical protein
MSEISESKRNVVFLKESNLYQFSCPYCDIIIEVEKNQLNCKIFRCGIMKSNGIQVNPHTSKTECDYLSDNNLVWGCCKPFRFIEVENNNYVEKCEYI